MRKARMFGQLMGCFLMVTLIGCSLIEDGYWDDFEKYKKYEDAGNCDFETDMKRYVLPSMDFIDRFEYEEAKYYCFQKATFSPSSGYNFSYLYFEYTEPIYQEAKSYMISEVKPFDDHYEYYGDFVFYENSKAVEKHRTYMTIESEFPDWFWMLGYNDVSYSMLFCGFCYQYGFDRPGNCPYTSWESILEATVLQTLDI